MTRLSRATVLVTASVFVVVLTACSTTAGPPVETTTPDTVRTADAVETASPQPTSEADTAAEQPFSAFQDVPEGYYVVNDGRAMVPERGGNGCEGLPSLEPRTDDDEDRVHGYWYSGLRDIGPIDGATGEAVYDEHDEPAAYVAAPGDAMSAIAARFCIDHYPYLEWINAIRRGEGTSIMDTGSMPLYAGDTINLDPYAIATVGDENGVVRDNAIDFHIPPQR